MTPFDILATKGLLPVAPATTTKPDNGVWYMAPDGWRQHGSDEFRAYDKRETNIIRVTARVNRTANIASAFASVLLVVVGGVWRGFW